MMAGWVVAAKSRESLPITVLLDPGHTPKAGGATSVLGIKEVVYNDRLAAIVSDSLAARGIRVLLTRGKEDEISLEDRVAVARASRAQCFISLHHDSAQPQYLQQADSGATVVFETRQPIRGYSVFVSAKNGQYARSLELGRKLSQSLLHLGRKPTLHHAEPIQGENRPLIDSTLGLYRFDDLIVLAKNPLPAVLIEYGVLVDRVDEAYISDPANQARFAQALSKTIRDFFVE